VTIKFHDYHVFDVRRAKKKFNWSFEDKGHFVGGQSSLAIAIQW